MQQEFSAVTRKRRRVNKALDFQMEMSTVQKVLIPAGGEYCPAHITFLCVWLPGFAAGGVFHTPSLFVQPRSNSLYVLTLRHRLLLSLLAVSLKHLLAPATLYQNLKKKAELVFNLMLGMDTSLKRFVGNIRLYLQ